MTTMVAKAPTHRKLLFTVGLAWLFDAMDVGIISFIMADLVQSWHLSPEQAGWLGSINSIGMAVGAVLAGIMADRYGRKLVLLLTVLLFSLASGLSAFATTFTILCIFRFFAGMGLGGELPVASTLVSELVDAKERGRIVVLLESYWAGGWILAAIIAYFIIPDYGWRAAMLISAVPALYTIYLRSNLPESQKIETIQRKTKGTSVGKNLVSLWSAPYTRPTLMLWILWFSVNFSYYGIFLWLPSVMVAKGFALIKSFQYVLVMTLAQLPGYFSAAWLIERFGRKFVLISYLSATAISSYFFGVADSFSELIISGVLLSFFNLGAWGALYAYTPEQYPTAFRTTGVGMAASLGRIGGIFGPLMIGYLVAAKVSFNVIFGIFFVVTLIGAFSVLILGTETRSRELVEE